MSGKSKSKELKYYGVNACLAIWEARKEDIIRVSLLQPRTREFSEMLKWCAQSKRAYHYVTPEDLEKLTAATHHQGVCVLALRKEVLDFDRLPEEAELAGPVLYLDGIENPHNFGSMLRIAAHFGVELVLGERGKIPGLSAAACRVAEGGAEFVNVAECENGRAALEELKRQGYRVVSTSSDGDLSIYDFKFSRKTVLVLGAEGEGVSEEISRCSDAVASIPGTGAVQSLNVSSACSVVLSEYTRQTWKS